jgi:hypothetical protein
MSKYDFFSSPEVDSKSLPLVRNESPGPEQTYQTAAVRDADKFLNPTEDETNAELAKEGFTSCEVMGHQFHRDVS